MIQYAWIGGILSIIGAAVFYACCRAGAIADERDELWLGDFPHIDPVPGYPSSHDSCAGSTNTASGAFGDDGHPVDVLNSLHGRGGL